MEYYDSKKSSLPSSLNFRRMDRFQKDPLLRRPMKKLNLKRRLTKEVIKLYLANLDYQRKFSHQWAKLAINAARTKMKTFRGGKHPLRKLI